MYKRCNSCKKEKNISEFGPNRARKDKLQTSCYLCRTEYMKEWYIANKKLQIERSKKSTSKMEERNKEFVIKYLLDNPCVSCGESDVLVLDFDHVRDIKEFDIAAGYRLYSLDVIKKEIEKCDIRCSNCHRRKTAIARNDWKVKYMGR